MEDGGSGGWCREVSESADAVDDQLGPAGSVAEVDDGAAGSSGEGRGDGVEPVAEPFRFPAAGFMTGQGQHRAPGLQLGGQGDDLAPDPILVEPVQREVGQACVFRDPDPVFAAGAATMPELQLLEGAEGGVGGEGGESVAVDVVEPQLSAGVGPFAADDHPHPGRPTVEIQQSGEVSKIGPLASLAIAVEGRHPNPLRDQVVEVGGVHGEGEPDRVRHPAPGQPLGELLRAAGPVRADQHAASGPRVPVGELRESLFGDGDVIGGGVRAGVPGA